MNDEAPEALRRLEQRLSQASDAAERLIAEATRATARERPPAAGWQAADDASEPRRPGELEALLDALHALRDLVPPDVLTRLVAALRELLLALRALIDFYLERIERPPASADQVQDIPID